MAGMSAAELAQMRYGTPKRRVARVIATESVPEQEPLAPVRKIEPTVPSPWGEPPPVVSYPLRQYEGDYKLHDGRGGFGGKVRAVTEGDLEELMVWGIPRFTKLHPRCTPEGMLPFLRMATQGGNYKFIRSDNACGIWCFARTPWEPLGSVFDTFVVGNDLKSEQQVVFEVVRLYRAGLAWARELKAAEFRFVDDNGYDLTAIAKRIGMDEDTVRLYRKAL